MSDERKISQLIKEAELNIGAGNHKEAEHRLLQAWEIAKHQKGLKHIRYASVNKRVRLLEEAGYINRVGFKKTKAGFEASIYELCAKTYLAILLGSINPENLLARVDEETASAILATLIDARNSDGSLRS